MPPGYFTSTHIPLREKTTVLCPGITEGTADPTDKRLFAAVHWASLANCTVVTDCEAPPPRLEFTTALKMSNNHISIPPIAIPSTHGAVFGRSPIHVANRPRLDDHQQYRNHNDHPNHGRDIKRGVALPPAVDRAGQHQDEYQDQETIDRQHGTTP
jgi:hypothetical protein